MHHFVGSRYGRLCGAGTMTNAVRPSGALMFVPDRLKRDRRAAGSILSHLCGTRLRSLGMQPAGSDVRPAGVMLNRT